MYYYIHYLIYQSNIDIIRKHFALANPKHTSFSNQTERNYIMFENLNNYKTFYTVAKTGNISHAADMLYISQPAISKSISKLEEGLGVKLFIRTAKGVQLTDEGEILYDHIKNAFESISEGEDELKRISELGIGQLRIGVSTSLCKYILLDYLQDFIFENPHIKVTIDCHSTINTIKLLQSNKIDIGLICHTDIPTGFTYKKVREIHDIFVANDSYLNNLRLRETEEKIENDNSAWTFSGNFTPLLKIKDNDKISTADILEKSNLMMLESNNITRRYIDSYLEECNIHPSQIFEISNMDLLIDFASIGMGVASVVREFAKEQLSSGQIKELPLDKPLEKRTVGFIYPKSNVKSMALQKFIEFCEL